MKIKFNYSFQRVIFFLFFYGILPSFKLYSSDSPIIDMIKPLTNTTLTNSTQTLVKNSKDWTFLVYIAANNNLQKLALKNLLQMCKVGSTDSINVLVQFDGLGESQIFRYYIEKGRMLQLNAQKTSTKNASGTARGLFDFIKWGIEYFPATHVAVDLWNHGAGIKDPSIGGKFLLTHRDEVYTLNPKTTLYELTKHKDFKSLIWEDLGRRGIAFNDTFQTYLTNQDLKNVLEDVVNIVMGGKKIDLICMDACHMAMIEVGAQIKNATKLMVGSMEVVPGRGYNYERVLKPFATGTLTAEEFAKHLVVAYKDEYCNTHAQYTQSALNLESISTVELLLSNLIIGLSKLLKMEPAIFGKLLKKIRNTDLTLEFSDADYIDLCFFLKNLSDQLSNPEFLSRIKPESSSMAQEIKRIATKCLNQMQNFIIKSIAGTSYPNAFGVAFYFPKYRIHTSYPKTVFDQHTNWSKFLNQYLLAQSWWF